MKKGQATIEYIICFVLAFILCWGVSILWNRNTILNTSTGGGEDAENVIHVQSIEN